MFNRSNRFNRFPRNIRHFYFPPEIFRNLNSELLEKFCLEVGDRKSFCLENKLLVSQSELLEPIFENFVEPGLSEPKLLVSQSDPYNGLSEPKLLN